MRHSEAWDVALLEVELLKAPVKIYQLKNFEYIMDTIDWEYDVESTDRISDEFIGSCPDVAEPLGGDVVEKGKAYLLKAEVAIIKNQSDTVHLLTRKAEEIFALTGYELGAADAQLLRIVSGTEPDIQKGLDDVQQLFSAKDYLPGLEQVIRHRSSDGVSLDSPRVISTSPEAHSALLPILKQSGNKFRFLLHQLNTMDTWISAPSFIAVCEKVFHPYDGFQSDELALLATKLLSYLYSINNNSREAATNALLHLQYSYIREFGEHLQPAIVNYLRVIADATSKLDDHLRVEELSNIANVWDKLLYKSVKEWDGICRSGKQIIYADLPIEAVLWLPNAVLSAASNNSLNLLSPLLLYTVSSNIQLAIELLGTLPVNLQSPFAHQIGGALGSAAEYCGNPILALLCYDAARCGCAHHDEFALRSLELHIGRLLASLIVWDRDSYCEFEEVARSYLHEVENFYWSDGRSQLSYKKGLQASLSLATSYLTTVQSLIEELDLGEDGLEEDRSLEQQENVDRLCQLLRTGLASTAKAISGRYYSSLVSSRILLLMF